MIKNLEEYLCNFRLKINADFEGKLKLKDFGDSGFRLREDMKIQPFSISIKNEDEEELIEERLKNQLLESEFDKLKVIHKDLIFQCINFI